ncbi:DUF4188 domain-containing protein [Plantactinospora sp. S1510]|uniref:DUF4188 domain-containing protein n=1 Tax=Plantactinospora alkalitolerans TaxID=2789879 RepID=A0ABS0GYG2_9ACTN|nr:DUF4188 domain-containing protein [Plantactinospora alkalitolerans]MBF9131239.1 DUF4188 domain-containing protein [Plantactinospora alkalitolerans]
MRTDDFSTAPAQARAGAMFIGATRYSGPLAVLRLYPQWLRMVRDLKRMAGYRWHTIYWEYPCTLGTIAFFTDRDAMLRFARSRHHRRLMQWVTDGTRNATGGYIRLYTAEPDGYTNGIWRAEGDEMAHIPTFTPLSTEAAGPAVRR